MKPTSLLLALVLIIACTGKSHRESHDDQKPSIAAEHVSPQQPAQAFYSELRRERIEGLPSAAQLQRLVPHLTADLVSCFKLASQAQTEFMRQHPDDKPPLVEGDLFSSSFEGVQTWQLGQAKVHGKTAEVPVSLGYSDEQKNKISWKDTLVLVQTQEGWRIDDIRMGGDWTFQAGGQTLRQTLSSKP